uniref:Uncharacterized protein n=1 Tax=Anopheles coluzzii TaxID=1518534 RepID=A0A8W7PKL9_ANOCL
MKSSLAPVIIVRSFARFLLSGGGGGPVIVAVDYVAERVAMAGDGFGAFFAKRSALWEMNSGHFGEQSSLITDRYHRHYPIVPVHHVATGVIPDCACESPQQCNDVCIVHAPRADKLYV